MTAKQFYDWQTSGGTDDVTNLVTCLERKDIPWCAIDGVAVNHWADEPMVTQDVDFVVAANDVERAIQALEEAGFKAQKHEWSVNFTGHSKVSIQLSTEGIYLSFPPGRFLRMFTGFSYALHLWRIPSRENPGLEGYISETKQANQGLRRHCPSGGVTSFALGSSASGAKAAGGTTSSVIGRAKTLHPTAHAASCSTVSMTKPSACFHLPLPGCGCAWRWAHHQTHLNTNQPNPAK